MATIELSLYEALTDIGVKPDVARKVERQMEGIIIQSQETVRAQMHQQLMTKGDGAELKAELKGDIAQLREELKGDIAQVRGEISQVREEVAHLRTDVHKAIRNQTLSLSVLIVAVAGLMLTLFK